MDKKENQKEENLIQATEEKELKQEETAIPEEKREQEQSIEKEQGIIQICSEEKANQQEITQTESKEIVKPDEESKQNQIEEIEQQIQSGEEVEPEIESRRETKKEEIEPKIETVQHKSKEDSAENQSIKKVEQEEEVEPKIEQVEEKLDIEQVKEEIRKEIKIEEAKEDKQDEKKDTTYFVKSESKKSKKKLMIIGIAIFIFLLLLVSTVFSLMNIGNEKLLKGITILGIDVGGLTAEEAQGQIEDAINSRFHDENNNLILKRNETEISVTANTFNSKFNIETSVAEAYNIGRSGNIIVDNYTILWTKIFSKEIKPMLYLDEELLNTTITDASAKMEDRVVENSYYVEDEELNIVKGKAGYVIKGEELKNKIYEQISNIHESYQVIEIPVSYKEPDPINLEKIREEIYKEPKDAYVEKKDNKTEVHPHVNGVDFGISMEEAKSIIQEDKEEYTIPLKITVAKKTINDLGEEAFPDLLASFSTIYDSSNRNRSTNIELSSKKMNGTVILPGEKFSYNTVVGKRTIEAGYKEGTAYIGGKVVPDVGGGTCQVSSTLYNTALLANLEITERSNHMFLTGYVAASRDATVYYGSLDFCFKNTRQYPIKIVANSSNGVCKVSIYGIKEETEYEVVLQSKVTSYINYKTTYKNDPTLPEGKEVVEQTGVNGCRSEGYKILKLNGKVVSQTLLSKDTYNAKEKIVRRGTKKVAQKPVVTDPEPSTPNNQTTTE